MAKKAIFALMAMLCFQTFLFSNSPKSSPSKVEYITLTMPKSGTHLLGKVFHLFEELGYQFPNGTGAHLSHPGHPNNIHPNIKPYLRKVKKLILIRDFRDVLVSAVFWYDRNYSNVPYWNSIPSFDEKLLALIEERVPGNLSFLSKNLEILDLFTNKSSLYYSDYTIIKFEKLIGVKGGGTYEDQVEELGKFAEYFGFNLTAEDFDYIAENLHGIRPQDTCGQTYRKGVIGEWKRYFKPHHIRAFNKRFGADLVKWGYEIE